MPPEPSNVTLVQREVAQSTDGRTGACAEATGQQLLLPLTTWRSEVGDNISPRESQGYVPATASTEELQSTAVAATLLDATAIRRRGPSLSRRIGQKGSVFQHSQKWDPAGKTYGRFWVDVPGRRRQRRTIALGVCRTASIAKQKLREYIETAGINSKQTFISTTAPATTLRLQAEKWIASLSTRRRKPVKPATIFGWQHALDKWILPNIGDKLLAEVSNGVLRGLVGKMAAAGLSPKTIVNYSQVVKLVVASAVNDDGEQLHPRKWNHDFIGLPIVEKEKQHMPTVTEAALGEILASSKERYAVLFSLLAGTGLRIGEALGLKPTDLSPDFRVLHVRRSIWHGQEQLPKTPNALREVDIAEPLARLLRGYVVGKSEYLFATASGRPLIQRNVLGMLHSTGKKVGFHAFRRFRTETLRRARVPEDLTKLWLGHSKQTVTDYYAGGLSRDLAWRQEWCERVGLGFSLLGLHGLQNVVPIDVVKAA
jgi:integrase